MVWWYGVDLYAFFVRSPAREEGWRGRGGWVEREIIADGAGAQLFLLFEGLFFEELDGLCGFPPPASSLGRGLTFWDCFNFFREFQSSPKSIFFLNWSLFGK